MEPLASWILDRARIDDDEATFVAGLAAELGSAGIGLTRISISFRTIHPEVWVRNVTWTPERGAIARDRVYEDMSSSDHVGSTVAAIQEGRSECGSTSRRTRSRIASSCGRQRRAPATT